MTPSTPPTPSDPGPAATRDAARTARRLTDGRLRPAGPPGAGRLALITCARSAGFSVAEVSRFMVARPSDADL
ncbi:hypothetical protein ACWEV0_29325, partial [Streptomyces sp. NPDC003943]